MKAIILTAGLSSRLKDITKDIPKGLLDISGAGTLERLVLSLEKVGITEIIMVVGYHKDKIKEKFSSNLHVGYVDNDDYENNNNADSLSMALSNDDPFMVINGDVICHSDLIKEVYESEFPNVLGCRKKREYNSEEMLVMFDHELNLTKMSKEMPEGFFEFTGVAKFSEGVDVLREILKTYTNKWFDLAVEEFATVSKGRSVKVLDVTHYPCLEIDFPEDLEEARDIFPVLDYPDWEFGIRHGSERNQQEIFELLKDMVETLEKYNITCWLNWGTLLGAYRDHQFIPWDTDVDVTIHERDRGLLETEVIPEMKAKGCFIPKLEICYDEDRWFIRDKEKIELNLVTPVGDKYVYSPGRCDLGCPKHYLDKLDKIMFMGKEFNIPSNTDEYLRLSYGDDWKTPIRDKKPISL